MSDNKIPNETGTTATEKVTHNPGEGIRSLKTSSLFRALNFELYAKPNKTIMTIGIAGIALTTGYLIYLNYSYDRSQFYAATNEDGTKSLRPKASRWDS